MNLDELKEKRKKLEKEKLILDEEISKIEQEEQQKAEDLVFDKINGIPESDKQILLKYLHHVGYCTDENPCNGFSSYSEEYRCPKCMMIEIFNGEHGGRYDFGFDVSIFKSTPKRN